MLLCTAITPSVVAVLLFRTSDRAPWCHTRPAAFWSTRIAAVTVGQRPSAHSQPLPRGVAITNFTPNPRATRGNPPPRIIRFLRTRRFRLSYLFQTAKVAVASNTICPLNLGHNAIVRCPPQTFFLALRANARLMPRPPNSWKFRPAKIRKMSETPTVGKTLEPARKRVWSPPPFDDHQNGDADGGRGAHRGLRVFQFLLCRRRQQRGHHLVSHVMAVSPLARPGSRKATATDSHIPSDRVHPCACSFSLSAALRLRQVIFVRRQHASTTAR